MFIAQNCIGRPDQAARSLLFCVNSFFNLCARLLRGACGPGSRAASGDTKWYEYLTYVAAVGLHVLGGSVLVSFW